MTNLEVINNYVRGLAGKSTNLRSTGDKLINYGTVLSQRTSDDFIINDTKYSVTTSKIQTQFRRELPIRQLENATIVENVPMGTYDLRKYID